MTAEAILAGNWAQAWKNIEQATQAARASHRASEGHWRTAGRKSSQKGHFISTLISLYSSNRKSTSPLGRYICQGAVVISKNTAIIRGEIAQNRFWRHGCSAAERKHNVRISCNDTHGGGHAHNGRMDAGAENTFRQLGTTAISLHSAGPTHCLKTGISEPN